MTQLKIYLRAAVSSMIAAYALIMLFTATAHAQTVTLGNTQSNPAIMRDADVYARRPLLVQGWVALKDGVNYTNYDGEVIINGLGTSTKPQEIPQGYRFIVEHIWANATLAAGEMIEVDLGLPLGGKSGENTGYSFVLNEGHTTHDGFPTHPVIFRPSYREAVRLYLYPGDISVAFTLNKPFTARSQIVRGVRVYLSGYLEKIPSTYTRPVPLFGAAANEDSSNNQQ